MLHSISNITELRNGRLPSDIIGEYIANTPVNYKYRNLWTSMSLTKPMFKDFMIRAELRYSHRKASYQEYMNQGGLWQFSSSIRYTNTMHKFGVIVEYQGYNNNSLSVAPQGKSTMDMDNIMISGYKTFFSDRLSINGGYILPIHLSSGYAKSISDTPVYASKSKEDEFADAINCFYIQIQYRFMGGKSIRQYEKDMSYEK